MNKVLLVEDDIFVYELVKISLKDYEVVHCPTLKDAEACLPKNQWSFIILDLNLPDGDGLRFLAKIKENDSTKNVPITILSAETGISHKVMAFDYGVDDYILKPFDPVEFKSRINSRVKKFQEKTTEMTRLTIGDLQIDMQLFKTFLKTPEKEIDLNLTALEIKILFYMAQKIDRVFSREQIMENFWKGTYVSDRTVDSHIAHIRQKLADAPISIETVKGVGYKVVKK